MKLRLVIGLLACLLTSCYEYYSERIVYYLSVREVLIQRMIQVYEEMGYALETDHRYPDSVASSSGLRDPFIIGIKGQLKIISTFRRKQAETSVVVQVSQAGARISPADLDKIADEVISRFEEKMRAK